MADEKRFADGFLFKKKDTDPEWVVGHLSVRLEDGIAMLQREEKNGWVNMNINRSREGKYYVEIDTFVPDSSKRSSGKSAENRTPNVENPPKYEGDDLPF